MGPGPSSKNLRLHRGFKGLGLPVSSLILGPGMNIGIIANQLERKWTAKWKLGLLCVIFGVYGCLGMIDKKMETDIMGYIGFWGFRVLGFRSFRVLGFQGWGVLGFSSWGFRVLGGLDCKDDTSWGTAQALRFYLPSKPSKR